MDIITIEGDALNALMDDLEVPTRDRPHRMRIARDVDGVKFRLIRSPTRTCGVAHERAVRNGERKPMLDEVVGLLHERAAWDAAWRRHGVIARSTERKAS
jgi:hypothetical protein